MDKASGFGMMEVRITATRTRAPGKMTRGRAEASTGGRAEQSTKAGGWNGRSTAWAG